MTLPMFLGSTNAPCKAFVESAHCLWEPNPGATVLALMESKVMVTFIHTPLYAEYQGIEYPLLLLTLKQAQIILVH